MFLTSQTIAYCSACVAAWQLVLNSAGLPGGAKFGKYCQKSLFSKTFANFMWQYF